MVVGGKMTELLLFTDGSVETKAHIGYGAYLVLADPGLPLDVARTQVKVRRFAPTSSTRLELQTLLWALTAIGALPPRLTVFTDSQNIVGLPARRARLVAADYYSAKGKRLNNYELYQEFYRLIDQVECTFVKVRGHQPAAHKERRDRFFTLVDRASRQALRAEKERGMRCSS
ncbi:MAG: RNase H family protein [Desulfurivibrionaceae bacterium]|nr:RNase H family protein [Desulfurivibrionaceae bacterium]